MKFIHEHPYVSTAIVGAVIVLTGFLLKTTDIPGALMLLGLCAIVFSGAAWTGSED